MTRTRGPLVSRRSAAAATAATVLALTFATAAAVDNGAERMARYQQLRQPQLQQQQSVLLECKDDFELGSRKYNFAELGKRTYDVVSSDELLCVNYHYAIRLCDKLPESSNCRNSRICEDSQTYNNGESVKKTFRKLAGDSAPNAALVQLDDSAAHPNVSLSFTSETAQSATVMLSCNPDVDDTAAKPVLLSREASTIVFAWQSKSACGKQQTTDPPPQKDPDLPPPLSPPGSHPGAPTGGETPKVAKKGMSVAGVVLLMLLIGITAYFLVGIYYNRTVYGAHGWDLLPHADFWRELPSLISDVIRHGYNSLFNRGPSGYSSMA